MDLKNKTLKGYIESLLRENQEDVSLVLTWLKDNTIKALNDESFYDKYREIKESYEMFVDRGRSLEMQLMRLDYDMPEV